LRSQALIDSTVIRVFFFTPGSERIIARPRDREARTANAEAETEKRAAQEGRTQSVTLHVEKGRNARKEGTKIHYFHYSLSFGLSGPNRINHITSTICLFVR